MPSWNDGSSSSPSYLGDLAAMDYAPDTTDDPTFRGIAVDCPEVCRGHKLEPQKCVAFEGTNTGRRFYMCQVQSEVNNYGFIDWLDDEWPKTAKNALAKLWGMFHDSNSARIEERIESAKLVQELAEEKNKLEKKYSSLLGDVKKFIEATEQKVVVENLARIKGPEMEELKNELEMVNNVHKSQAEIMKSRQKTWEDEREALKEEKKKAEYMLYDLLQVSEVNKGKIKRIKEFFYE